jgi:hypothetical protein
VVLLPREGLVDGAVFNGFAETGREGVGQGSGRGRDRRQVRSESRVGPSFDPAAAGGDLTGGWIDDGKVVCPMHSMEFDTKTGASACKTLAPLRRYGCSVRDGRVYVDADEVKAG